MKKEDIAVWLEKIVKELVPYPDDILAEVKEPDEEGVLFTIKTDSRNAGAVIGKRGDIANALRTLLRAVGFKNEIRATLKIDVPDVRERS